MRRYCLLLFLLLPTLLFGTKLPEISPSDVKETLQKIMDAHASHKTLTPDLVSRALEEYLDILDPTKTYFLQNDISRWEKPSPQLLERILEEFGRGEFVSFSQIHDQMASAIKRREKIEKKIAKLPLSKDVSISEFKEMTWAETEEELSARLHRLKALQASAAEKLGEEMREKALLRINKKRLLRQEDFLSHRKQERERLILSNVLKAFAASFDTHTAYFTPGEASQFMIQVQQRLFGIGAQLRDDLSGFTVVKIIDGGPASQDTGLEEEDQIVAIDGEPVVGLEITDAVELIRGAEGTVVTLTVLRHASDETLDIKITRGEVVIKEARIESTSLPFGDGVIAHIALHAFYQDPQHTSASDLFEEISKIRKEHKLKGIILDLRHNSGGVLPQAVAVTGLFITKGIIVSIKDNKGNVEHLRDIDGRTAWDGPLIVLTSKASASAAEIVAQTLQDYGRAIIVGDEHTYGKGTFQTFTLNADENGKINPKGEFKVTRGRYYTVSGKSPQLTGVEPDFVIPGPFSSMEIGERYAKYPLETDVIAENYLDDLSDIPEVQRDQISWLYRYNLQPRLKTYTRFLPVLKKNSFERIDKNPFYQSFLGLLDEEEVAPTTADIYSQVDLQLQETINVMKDLVVLLQ